MNVITTSRAGTKLPYLINEVADSHKPILITGQHVNAVLQQKKIGPLFRKRFICYQYRGCENLLEKAYKHLLKNVLRN